MPYNNWIKFGEPGYPPSLGEVRYPCEFRLKETTRAYSARTGGRFKTVKPNSVFEVGDPCTDADGCFSMAHDYRYTGPVVTLESLAAELAEVKASVQQNFDAINGPLRQHVAPTAPKPAHVLKVGDRVKVVDRTSGYEGREGYITNKVDGPEFHVVFTSGGWGWYQPQQLLKLQDIPNPPQAPPADVVPTAAHVGCLVEVRDSDDTPWAKTGRLLSVKPNSIDPAFSVFLVDTGERLGPVSTGFARIVTGITPDRHYPSGVVWVECKHPNHPHGKRRLWLGINTEGQHIVQNNKFGSPCKSSKNPRLRSWRSR